MSDAPDPTEDLRSAIKRSITPRKAALQVAGFLIGLALVVWVVKIAIDAANDPTRAGIMESVRAAWESRPWLLVGLAATTAASLVIDGALFWLVLWPVRRLGFMEIQWLTYVAALSNFFPVRLGVPVRYAYHMRANRFTFFEATAWFIGVTLVILMALIAVVVATVADKHPNVLWGAIVLAGVGLGGLTLRALALCGPVQRRLQGWDRMLTTQRTYWAGALLRVIEILLWIVRMWCAAEILNLGLSFATVTILGVAAITMMLNPLSRFGPREATTVIVASWLAGNGTDPTHLRGEFAQLAILESLGEMLTTIPMGVLAMPMVVRWYRRRRSQPAAMASGQIPLTMRAGA